MCPWTNRGESKCFAKGNAIAAPLQPRTLNLCSTFPNCLTRACWHKTGPRSEDPERAQTCRAAGPPPGVRPGVGIPAAGARSTAPPCDGGFLTSGASARRGRSCMGRVSTSSGLRIAFTDCGACTSARNLYQTIAMGHKVNHSSARPQET